MFIRVMCYLSIRVNGVVDEKFTYITYSDILTLKIILRFEALKRLVSSTFENVQYTNELDNLARLDEFSNGKRTTNRIFHNNLVLQRPLAYNPNRCPKLFTLITRVMHHEQLINTVNEFTGNLLAIVVNVKNIIVPSVNHRNV